MEGRRRVGTGMVAVMAWAVLAGCKPPPEPSAGATAATAIADDRGEDEAMRCMIEGAPLPGVTDADAACRILADALDRAGYRGPLPDMVRLVVTRDVAITAAATMTDGRALPVVGHRSADRPIDASSLAAVGDALADVLTAG